MSESIRILYVDDYLLDRELVRDALEKESGGFQVTEARSRADFEARLAEGEYDLVLSDFNILGFEGLQVIDAVHARNPRVPVIIVTGTGSEEIAVEALKRGAADYVLKSPKHIRRLPLVIHAALEKQRLEEASVRGAEALRASETSFRYLFANNPHPMWVYDLETLAFLEVNDATVAKYGYTRDEFLQMRITDIRPAEDVARLLEQVNQGRPAIQFSGEWRHRLKDGTVIDVEIVSHILEFNGRKTALVVAHDITERKQANQKIEGHLARLEALHSIDQAISSSFDLRVTLNVLLNYVTAQLRVDAASVLVLNPHLNTLEFAAGHGFRGSGVTRLSLRLGEDYAGKVALERRRISVPNLKEAERPFTQAHLTAGEDFIGYFGVPLIAKGKVKGVLEIFHRAPLSPDPEWLEFLETLAGQAAIAIDNVELFNGLQNANSELILSYDATIEGWSRALDLRDKETEGHTQRVIEMTLELARRMGIRGAELAHVRRGALLHDIGKLGVPDNILLKPEPLTDEEWKLMRKHPEYAFQLLSPITYLRLALDVPYCHHEKWDGTGYPRRLKGEQIPLVGRIFAIVDVWDALISDRPYRPAWTQAKAREHIRSLAGTHFDPKVAQEFLKLVPED